MTDRPAHGLVPTYRTGLIVGRFDPPHLGHSLMIDRASAHCEELVVLVNSSHDDGPHVGVSGSAAR